MGKRTKIAAMAIITVKLETVFHSLFCQLYVVVTKSTLPNLQLIFFFTQKIDIFSKTENFSECVYTVKYCL